MGSLFMCCWIFAWSLVVILGSSVVSQTKGCIFGSSEGCAYKCNCVNDSACNSTTGECPAGCQEGNPRPPGKESLFDWRGPGCKIGNVAFSKDANQSGFVLGLEPMFALDGRLPSLNGDTENCVHTDPSRTEHAWLMIDLNDVYSIHNITIYNRRSSDSARRTGHFDIRIGKSSSLDENPLCTFYEGPVPAGGSDTVTCNTQLSGRYVSLQRTGGLDPNIINLCEVVVMGYKKVYPNCSNCLSSCDDVVGCTACNGYEAPLCKTKCKSGSYGLNCAFSCEEHKCKHGSNSCFHESGECPGGCQDWYSGNKCDKFIAVAHIRSNSVQAVCKSSTAITVSWQGADDVKADLVEYYGYQVQYKLANDSQFITANNVSHVHGAITYSADVTRLIPNTIYTARVTTYRRQGELFDDNSSEAQNAIISALCSSVSAGEPAGSCNVAVIAGSVVAGVVVIIVVQVTLMLVLRKRNLKPSRQSDRVQIPPLVNGQQTNQVAQVNNSQNVEMSGYPTPYESSGAPASDDP